MNREAILQSMPFRPHDEGGYYCVGDRARTLVGCPERPGGERPAFSSIYYLLTRDCRVGYLHCNKSDIIHLFHAGSPITYFLVSPHGELHTRVLGDDVQAGQEFRITVRGGTWKATFLPSGEYGLVSEVVVPGFDFRDREMATADMVKQLFPDLWPRLAGFIKCPGEEPSIGERTLADFET